MKTDINLLSALQSEEKKEEKTLSLLRIISVGSILFVGISSILIFLIVQAISPESIEKKEKEVISKVSVLRPKQAKLILVSQKIKNIQKIITKRSEYNEVLKKVVANIPSSVVVNSMNIDEQKIHVSVGSNSLAVIDEFLNNFINLANEKDTIGSLTIENMSLGVQSGRYTVSIAGERI